MSDTNTNTDTATRNTTPTPAFKLNAGEVVTQLQSYLKQAEQSLTQLGTNIETGQRQLDEWKRMQLMLVGQRQVTLDLLNKIVEIPSSTTTV